MLLGSEAIRNVNTKTVHRIMKNPTALLYSAVSVPPYAWATPNAGVRRAP